MTRSHVTRLLTAILIMVCNLGTRLCAGSVNMPDMWPVQFIENWYTAHTKSWFGIGMV